MLNSIRRENSISLAYFLLSAAKTGGASVLERAVSNPLNFSAVRFINI